MERWILCIAFAVLGAAASGCSDGNFTGREKQKEIHYGVRGEDATKDDATDQKNGKKGHGKGGKDSSDGDDANALGNSADEDGGGMDSGSDSAGKGKGSLGDDGEDADTTEVAFQSFNLCSTHKGTELVGTNLSQETTLIAKLYPVGGGETIEAEVNGSTMEQAIVSGNAFTAKLPIKDGTYNMVLCAPSQRAECHFVESPSDANETDIKDYFKEYGESQKAVAVAERPFTVQDGEVLGQPKVWTVVSGKQEDDPAYCNEDLGTGENGSPLMVDFSGKGIYLSSPQDGVSFDLYGDGWLHQISWPRSNLNAFLALDKNGNGLIDTGNELFGDHSVGPDGARSANGFLALAKYDDNKDGIIDSKDAVFSNLRLWTDLNCDGKTDLGELRTLTNAHVKQFALTYKTRLDRDRFKNEIRERSFAVLDTGSTLPVYDVWFRVNQPSISVFETFVQWIKSLV